MGIKVSVQKQPLLLLTLLIGLSLPLIGCSNLTSGLTNKSTPTVTTTANPVKTTETPSIVKKVDRDISIPILYYHSITSIPKNELCMPPEQFEKEIAYLSQHGYHSVTLNQLYNYFYGNGQLPEKPIVVTFDDGYKDNYTNAFPILKKYNFTATVFVITSNVGHSNNLSWSQLQELTQNGWLVESHTVSHYDLTKLDSKKLAQELNDSKTNIEKQLGTTVDFFAYPSGRFNAKVERAVKGAGYRMAFTTQRGWADRAMDPLAIHRVYCFASMRIAGFGQRVQNPNY
ncbi:MAG: polysaccharide deacetylase family protein [Desulfosporosinus sp.]|nr:polysaccharide deacetylase family protein [Desulfosporosinus sp.]